jgi:beta-glucosidase
MATIDLGHDSPTEGEVRHIDLKQATVHVQPMTLDTPSSTPATTPEQNSPSDEVMAGKKIFSLERPTDRARELASKLTLEEQVRMFLLFAIKSPDPSASICS